MNKVREQTVELLFKDLDQPGAGEIETKLLLSWFKPEKHPDARNGLISSDVIREGFVESLTLFGRLGVNLGFTAGLRLSERPDKDGRVHGAF